MISCAKLDLLIDIPAIQTEVQNLPQTWTDHFNTKHYTGQWTVLPLRSPGGTAQIIPDIMGEQEYNDASSMDYCPSVKKLINSMACCIMSVRLLNLKAGALIKPHRDHELAFEKGEARLHIPVFTNPEVKFYIEEELIPMQTGQCWYINANLTHWVSNFGESDRIHLIIDCKVNGWLKEIFERAEKCYKTEAQDVQQQLQIIEALRLQDTDTSNKLADILEFNLRNNVRS